MQLTLARDGDSLRRAAVGPAFARHETFYPRFGWLKKGFDRAQEDPEVFLRDDAGVRLGVGKNMARSIRYWCHAFKLLDEATVPGSRSQASHPSEFGTQLLGFEGWDPYLEDPASLWLLHWKLLSAPCTATAWHVAFGVLPSVEFSVETLSEALADYTNLVYPSARTAPSSFRKDAMLLVRMYGEPNAGGIASEETLHCQFADLGLLRRGSAAKTYAFQLGAKPGLPAEIIVAAALEYASQEAGNARTVPLSRLLADPTGPGMAFKLSEGALCDAIEEVARRERRVQLSDTAGMLQLVFEGDEPADLAARVLHRYYTGSSRGLSAPSAASNVARRD